MILIILGGAALLAMMFLMILLSVKADSLRLLEKVVCRSGEKLEIRKSVASHHQPGEKSLEIYCNDYGSRRVVNGRALFAAWAFSFVLMLPFSAMIVFAINKFWLD